MKNSILNISFLGLIASLYSLHTFAGNSLEDQCNSLGYSMTYNGLVNEYNNSTITPHSDGNSYLMVSTIKIRTADSEEREYWFPVGSNSAYSVLSDTISMAFATGVAVAVCTQNNQIYGIELQDSSWPNL